MAKSTSTRSLKVEALRPHDFNFYHPERSVLTPRIRIMGRWLAAAGFKPDSRVSVQIEASGRIVLVAQPKTEGVA